MIGIIGSGSWATALTKILLENKNQTLHWWVRNDATRQSLTATGHNPRHLSSVTVDTQRLTLSSNLGEVVAECDILLLAVPSAYVNTTLSMLPAEAYRNKQFVSAVKGTIPDCCMSVAHYLEKVVGIPKENICMVSGPSHAEEVALELPTFLTVASHNIELAKEVAELLRCDYCHTSTTNDIDGIEHCVLAKNIYAIAAGICQGLGYGDNLNAVLTSAAMREIGGQMERHVPQSNRNLFDYCYLGDLMVTCWSNHSRNRALGVAVAHGENPQQVFERTGSVAEGYYSVKNMHTICQRLGCTGDIPIAEAIYHILYEGSNPKEEIDYLINNIF